MQGQHFSQNYYRNNHIEICFICDFCTIAIVDPVQGKVCQGISSLPSSRAERNISEATNGREICTWIILRLQDTKYKEWDWFSSGWKLPVSYWKATEPGRIFKCFTQDTKLDVTLPTNDVLNLISGWNRLYKGFSACIKKVKVLHSSFLYLNIGIISTKAKTYQDIPFGKCKNTFLSFSLLWGRRVACLWGVCPHVPNLKFH